MARRGAMGGVGLMLAMLITSCGGGTAQSAEPQKPDTVSVNAGYDPRIYTEDPWQLGYCVSVENDAAEEHEDGGEYGTGSYADLLSDRPCTLDMAFGYGKILKKHHLVGEHDAGRVWSVLADTEPKFVENVVQFSDGYAENFINR